jgi:hypothetical protein
MLTLVTFVRDLMLSGAVVYATFCIVHLAILCALWFVRTTYQLDGRGGDGSFYADGIAPICPIAAGAPSKGVPVNRIWRHSSADVAIFVSQASEALFAYERRMVRARSEIRETVAWTHHTIAQTQALIAEADAVAAGFCHRNPS